MDLDNKKIVTQDETGEPAAIDQVEDRVEAEMKKLEGEAKKFVADGLQETAFLGGDRVASIGGVGKRSEIVLIHPELDQLPFVGLQLGQCCSKVLRDARDHRRQLD